MDRFRGLGSNMVLKSKVYGYRNNEAENKVDIVPEEIEAVKYIHGRFHTGYPTTWSADKKVGAIVKEAKVKNFPVPPSGYWNKKVVVKILMDSIYSGRRHEST